ncbi:hypothetical protein RhiLY_06260 [Ceratobasidium sp. AG-Ba]|nr:hypothetical protein RhiLY_06260 [Ceratobasidium sp. AG-Ba]
MIRLSERISNTDSRCSTSACIPRTDPSETSSKGEGGCCCDDDGTWVEKGDEAKTFTGHAYDWRAATITIAGSMDTRRAFSTTGDVAIQLLRLTAASADVFPPLKSAAGAALHIAEMIKASGFKSNKAEWRELGIYVQDATASVVESIARLDTAEDIGHKLEKLQTTLAVAAKSIEEEQALPLHRRFGKFLRDPDMIIGIRKNIDDAIALFQLIALDKLRRVPGASWDSSRLCLENTRVDLIKDLMSWISSPGQANYSNHSGGASIMLLTAVAGAGKTTIAHTIAQRCAENKRLGSCFFFDRETDGRNSPVALFTTMASDLSLLDTRIAYRVATAIEDDRSLPLAPISTQFDKLVFKPCEGISITEPVAIIIDALDEAWDATLLDILQNRVEGLPRAFRILITSRMRPELNRLCHKAHVERTELDIGALTNTEDMVQYAAYKLQQVAQDRDLGDSWPGEELRLRFTAKAGGLFLWATTVCDYLRRRDDPTEELRRLTSESHAESTSAETRMDVLYATILESYDWTDDSFVASYSRVMGTAIASKTPLTILAMKQLYHGQTLASNYTLQTLSPLLTGMMDNGHESQPVRLLHQSLRDFLVVRSRFCSGYSRFALDEGAMSSNLAVLCLGVLNYDLEQKMSFSEYLSVASQNRGIPELGKGEISEALWYACRFWVDHVCDVEDAGVVQEGLLVLWENNITTWLAVMASNGQCRGLSEVREWMENRLHHEIMGRMRRTYENYADACWNLSEYLDYDDRREDSLVVTTDSVAVYRQLAAEQPDTHLNNLAMQIVNLSRCLSNLGRPEEGLVLAEEAVGIYRMTTATNLQIPASKLDSALHTLSVRLSEVGRYEDALPPIQEAVDLRRKLATDLPAVYTTKLATSLLQLSTCLYEMGRNEDALPVVQEAVDLQRKLAADQPSLYTPDLASSLHALSIGLSELGRYEDGLSSIQEAVDLRRKLATQAPAVHIPDLASSLHSLSVRLSKLNRYEDALPPIQEAVDLYRRLATDRPAVYIPDLALSLQMLSACFYYLCRFAEGLPVTQEAVDLHRKLAAARPNVYSYYLADSLITHSASLSELGQHENALPPIQEAIIIHRSLAKDRPKIHLPKVAMSLYNLSWDLSQVARHEEALLAVQESVEIYRQLAGVRPAVFWKAFGDSLLRLSDALRKLHRDTEALAVTQEADQLQA